MDEADHRLFTLANTAALVLFKENGNPSSLSVSQKVLADQGANLLKAYRVTVVIPAMQETASEIARLREALQKIADGHGGSAFAARALLQSLT